MSSLGEFFFQFGFNVDSLKIRDFTKALGDLPVDAGAAIAALAGVEYELVKIAQQAFETAVSFQMFSAETGLSWQELQKWQIVAEQANVSAGAVASSLSALERQMAEIRLGRGNIAPFQLLGISPNQDAFSVLRQLRERIKGLQPAMATNLIAQMGIDPSLIHVLQLSNNEFDRLSKTVRGMSGDQEGSFLRAKQTLVQFGLYAKYLGFDILGTLINNLQALVTMIRGIQVWTPGLIVAFGAIAAAIFPITAAVVGLLLVLDDLSVYFQGGQSVTGTAIQNVNVNVNSTAPAHDVAKEVKAHIDRAASQASLQTNQQGY